MKNFWCRKIYYPLRAVLALFGMMVNGIVLPLCVFIFGPFMFLMPTRNARRVMYRFLNFFTYVWCANNSILVGMCVRKRLHIVRQGEVVSNKWYLLLSNHQCYMDILMVDKAMNHIAPPSRFFMKKSLLWQLPILSWVCWLLGYPFLDRKSKRPAKASDTQAQKKARKTDAEKTRKACDVFRMVPVMATIYPEGTRFTQKKHDKQQSPFTHLLKPKVGGAALVFQELQGYLAGIINMTINYSGERPNIWRVLSCQVDRIDICYEVLPVTPDLIGDYAGDREYRTHIQKWLNVLWTEKDLLLSQLKEKNANDD